MKHNNLKIKLNQLKLQLLLAKVEEYDAPWLKEKNSVCRNPDGSFASCSEGTNDQETNQYISQKIENIDKISKESKNQLIKSLTTNEIKKLFNNNNPKDSNLINKAMNLLFNNDNNDDDKRYAKSKDKIFNKLEINSPEEFVEMAINLKKSNLNIVPLINNAIKDGKYSLNKNQFDLSYRIKKLNELNKKEKLSKKEVTLKEVNEDILKADIEYGEDIRNITRIKTLEKELTNKISEAYANNNTSKINELTSSLKNLDKKTSKKESFNNILNHLSKKSDKNHISITDLKKKNIDISNLPILKGVSSILGNESFDKRLIQLVLRIMPGEKVPKLEEINFNQDASDKSKRSLESFNKLIGKDINIILADINTKGRAFSFPLGKTNLIKINEKGFYGNEAVRRSIIYHEASHAIEAQNPEVLKKSKEYLFDRAKEVSKDKKEKYEVIRAIRSIERWKEYAIDGGFIHPYTGKIYSIQPAQSIIANGLLENELLGSEILSMGAESLSYIAKFEDHVIKDKDHILYTLSALHNK